MSEKVLFIDDDPNLIEACQQQLKQLELALVACADEAIEAMDEHGPFAVVVADMTTPGTNGLAFLAEARERHPDTVRIVLTEHLDYDTAIEAVNDANVFRFLPKPSPPEVIAKTLIDAVEQYEIINSDRELLEKTIRSSVKVLTEILSLTNPTAFSRASRIRVYAKHIAKQLRLPSLWKFEVAAMLSQIGCVTLPPIVLNKIYGRRELTYTEQKMFSSHPKVGRELLAKIPRLEQVARMIEHQQTPFSDQPDLNTVGTEERMILLGGQMLKASLDFEQLVTRAISPAGAISALRKRQNQYNPKILRALETFKGEAVDVEVKELTVKELKMGMVTDQHVKSSKGLMLLPMGHEITYSALERLRNFAQGETGLQEPIRVRMITQDDGFED